MRLLHCLACAMLFVAGSAVAQESSEQHDLNIGRMSLTDALVELSLQTGFSVLYSPRTKRDDARIVGPLRGRYAIEEALRILLAPHGLKFTRTADRAFAVLPPDDSAGAAEEPHRLADKKAKPHARMSRAPEPAALAPGASGTAGYAPYAGAIEHVTVTGTRLAQHGVGSAPVMTLTREKLAQLGVATLVEALIYIAQQPYTYSESHRINGQYAEIRGLGADATLVLINGRRVPPSAASAAVNAFDLNTIPLTAVERVDVLAGSASAIYGADAMGGVVNVILRKEIEESVVDIRYGAAAGGADERRASFSTGLSGERFTAALVLDYFDRMALFGAERDRWRDQDYRRHGAADRRSLSANPGNISSLTLANLPSLPSRIAAVPHGTPAATQTDFAATAGTRNLESLLAYWSAIPETNRASAAAYGDVRLTPRTTGFAELLYTHRKADFESDPPALVGAVVPAANPFNPFETPVVVNYLLTDLGRRVDRGEAELVRAVTGARGDWGQWAWELSTVVSDESASITSSNWLDPARVAAALSSSDRDSALNVFGDGPAGSRALLRSLTAPPSVNRFDASMKQAAGFVRGPVLRLPGGEVSAVVGAEWRNDKLHGAGLVARDRDVSGLFSELQIPLVSARAELPGVRELSLTLAARFDSYEHFDDKVNPQYGLVWRPHADLALRSSFGKTFRPPSLYELYAPRIVAPAQFQDARRNGEIASLIVVTGGNPDLEPTEGDSLTAGVVYTPALYDAFKAGVSYWRVRIDNRVAIPSLATALADENAFPDRVRRAEPTPADAAVGLPGRLAAVDATYGNFDRVETSGVDVEASYSFETRLGRVTPRITAVWTGEFDCNDHSAGHEANRVGVASPLGTIPRWRGVANVELNRGAWRTSATARYTHSYDDANGFVRTGRKISAQTLVDVQAAFELEELAAPKPLRGLTLTVGVQNLFDEEPEFSEVNTVTGYDLSQGDLRKRFSYVSLSKRF